MVPAELKSFNPLFQGIIYKERICNWVLCAKGSIVVLLIHEALEFLVEVTRCFGTEAMNGSIHF